jgi:hypothetical protein
MDSSIKTHLHAPQFHPGQTVYCIYAQGAAPGLKIDSEYVVILQSGDQVALVGSDYPYRANRFSDKPPLRIGDRVECIRGELPDPKRKIPKTGKFYIVEARDTDVGRWPIVQLKGVPGWWAEMRFERRPIAAVEAIIPMDTIFDGLGMTGELAVMHPPVSLVEIDPHGTDAHAPGAKLDAGKPRAGLLQDFGNALLAVAEVSTHGVEKYSEGGWLQVPNGEARYRDAGMRHRLQMATQTHDDKSGLDHLAHVAWNVLAELEFRIRSRHD